MNNKWYSLTRPAVVQFNPPRDNMHPIENRSFISGSLRRANDPGNKRINNLISRTSESEEKYSTNEEPDTPLLKWKRKDSKTDHNQKAKHHVDKRNNPKHASRP